MATHVADISESAIKTPPPNCIICTENLWKTYEMGAEKVHALRGVNLSMNRGEYVAAQELFERALKREPDAAHIHYGLAATRARLGAIDTALKSLRRALDLQPKLRIRAQRDHDLNPLRSDPEFDNLVFARE